MRALPVFIGYDSREPWSWEVARHSLERHSSIPLCVHKLDRSLLENAGFYHRSWHKEGKQFFDDRDGKPFSTEFSFSRFLVPALCMYQGWALFCDGDFLFIEDLAKLERFLSNDYAAIVVKHNHETPGTDLKMDGVQQSPYFRKNWSSFVLWNCEHPSNRSLTARVVNHNPGGWLHAFRWLVDEEIGELPREWNYLVGVNPPMEGVNALHYTLGTPEFENHRNGPYADLWLHELGLCKSAMLRNAA